MKRKINILLLLFFIGKTSIGQINSVNAYYDAIELEKLVHSPAGFSNVFDVSRQHDIVSLLKVYYPHLFSVANKQFALKLSDSADPNYNPFLKPYLLEIVTSGDNLTPSSSGLKSGISALGGLNITSFADGLAKFLVQRTKQELTIAFFEDFKEEINKKDELRIMFPNTKRVLDAIGEEVYQYSAYLNSLKEAFELDLDNILITLDTYITKKHSDKKQIVEPISGTLYFSNHLKNGEHPAEAASKLAKREDPLSIDTDAYKNFIYALRVLDIFSQSLRSNDTKNYWISRDSLNLLTSNEIAFKIYLGLLYQKHKDDKTFPTAVGNTFGAYLIAIKDKVDDLKEPIQGFVGSAENLNSTVKSLKEKQTMGENVGSYFELLNNTLVTIGKSDELAEKLGVPKNELKEFDKYLYILDLINSISLDVKERKYNSAVINVVALSDTLNISDVFKKEFLKYGTFIANVAQAENSDQVQAAIEAIALPVGSASIKKKTAFNIALNGYVGLAGGYELNGNTENWAGTFGLHTPIGVTFSWGKHKIRTKHKKGVTSTKKRDISHSLFLSVVDISAFSSFRFNDSETAELPEVTLSNIFAPGLYYIKGFNKVPISWGIGGQFGPQLREVTATTINTTGGLNFSFRTFIAVDIPLLNFYTKSR